MHYITIQKQGEELKKISTTEEVAKLTDRHVGTVREWCRLKVKDKLINGFIISVIKTD